MKAETLSIELRAQLAFEADARRIPAESTLTGGYAPASAGVLMLPAPSCGCAIVHRPGCPNFFAGVT